jgi:hypothetical protein
MTTHLIRLRSRAAASRKATPAPHPLALRQGAEQVAAALGNPVQTKLTLGAPGDMQEREADAIADRVMRVPDPAGSTTTVQRKCAQCEEEEQVRRKGADEEKDEEKDEEEKKVRTKSEHAADAGPVSASAAAGIESARGGGEALPAGERAFFEPRLGAELSSVRVHDDADAARLNRQLGARAFTVGHDLFFAQGEYRPGTPGGRHLIAHELAHVMQQREGETVRRWNLGAAPAPHGWSVVTDAEQVDRLDQAETIVEGVVNNRNCRNFFRDNCTTAGGGNLRNVFDNANVYVRPVDDNVFGEGEFGGNNIAFNLRAFRIGRYMMASTLLHEMFHNCDPTGAGTGRAAELNAENATETCRLHTPWIDTVSPRSAAAGSRVTLRGWGFGPLRGSSDSVEIGGLAANVISWEFMAGTSSRVEIVVEVPAGAGSGGVVVINNGVRSNTARLTVT